MRLLRFSLKKTSNGGNFRMISKSILAHPLLSADVVVHWSFFVAPEGGIEGSACCGCLGLAYRLRSEPGDGEGNGSRPGFNVHKPRVHEGKLHTKMTLVCNLQAFFSYAKTKNDKPKVRERELTKSRCKLDDLQVLSKIKLEIVAPNAARVLL